MELKVHIFRRPNLFRVNDNMYNQIGVGELEKIMINEGYKTSGALTLFYPERFLNIVEQRLLIDRAENAGIEKLEIVTNSVYIIQCAHKDSCFIHSPKGEDLPELGDKDGQFKKSVDYSGLPDDTGLNVL